LIAPADIAELRVQRASEAAIISLYLNVPLDIAEHRGLTTKARELIKAAAIRPPGQPTPSDADIASIAEAVDVNSRDWLGHTAAIFACARLGLFKAIPLPGITADRAVLDARPYIRPLLAALQRNPAYQIAVIDTERAWLLAVVDDETDTLAQWIGPAVPKIGFAGWHGFEAYRMQQRIMELSMRHYRDTISILARATDEADQPLVLGGHEMQIHQFMSLLPHSVRERVAGSFNVDTQTATPARVRDLAAPVIASWTESAEAKLVDEVLGEPPEVAVTTGLRDCVTAVRARAVSQLVLADDQVVPGCACSECGAIGIGPAGCDCADQACRPVPDVLDVLTEQALDGGGQVTAVREAPFTVAARLRFAPAGLARAG
jgi:peptide chain release factor subunit 1